MPPPRSNNKRPHHRGYDDDAEGYSGLFVASAAILGAFASGTGVWWAAHRRLAPELEWPPGLLAPIPIANENAPTPQEVAALKARVLELQTNKQHMHTVANDFFGGNPSQPPPPISFLPPAAAAAAAP